MAHTPAGTSVENLAHFGQVCPSPPRKKVFLIFFAHRWSCPVFFNISISEAQKTIGSTTDRIRPLYINWKTSKFPWLYFTANWVKKLEISEIFSRITIWFWVLVPDVKKSLRTLKNFFHA